MIYSGMIQSEKIERKSLTGNTTEYGVRYRTPKGEGYVRFPNRSQATRFATEKLAELLDGATISGYDWRNNKPERKKQ